MVHATLDAQDIEAAIHRAGKGRHWRVECGMHVAHVAKIRWKDDGEQFMALRHQGRDGQLRAMLLSAPANGDGDDQLAAAAEFARDRGFERLLEALRADTVEA